MSAAKIQRALVSVETIVAKQQKKPIDLNTHRCGAIFHLYYYGNVLDFYLFLDPHMIASLSHFLGNCFYFLLIWVLRYFLFVIVLEFLCTFLRSMYKYVSPKILHFVAINGDNI